MKKQPKNWLVFSGLAFQIGIVMYLMVRLGGWIQQKRDIDAQWPTMLTVFLGMLCVILLILKQSKRS
jgi:hypothetical protein